MCPMVKKWLTHQTPVAHSVYVTTVAVTDGTSNLSAVLFYSGRVLLTMFGKGKRVNGGFAQIVTGCNCSA